MKTILQVALVYLVSFLLVSGYRQVQEQGLELSLPLGQIQQSSNPQ